MIGAVFGSAGAPGAIIPELFSSVGNIEQWVRLLSGIGVVLVLIQAPDGLAWLNIEGVPPNERKGAQVAHRGPRQASASTTFLEVEQQRVRSSSLEVRSLTVRFGGVVAVDNVSFAVGPGEVVG